MCVCVHVELQAGTQLGSLFKTQSIAILYAVIPVYTMNAESACVYQCHTSIALIKNNRPGNNEAKTELYILKLRDLVYRDILLISHNNYEDNPIPLYHMHIVSGVNCDQSISPLISISWGAEEDEKTFKAFYYYIITVYTNQILLL